MPQTPKLSFMTQRPREDGCGGVVLQMLTGLPFETIMTRIGWGEHDLRRSTWQDVLRILKEEGFVFGEVIEAKRWDEVQGLAVVQVEPDHFMIFDAETAQFYDPFLWEGPQESSARVPMRYLSVTGRNFAAS